MWYIIVAVLVGLCLFFAYGMVRFYRSYLVVNAQLLYASAYILSLQSRLEDISSKLVQHQVALAAIQGVNAPKPGPTSVN